MINFFYPLFKWDSLNSFVVLAIGLFSVLTIIYSFGFMKGKQRLFQYYTYIILTAAASVLAVLSNHLALLLLFWGFLGLTLYLLVNMGDNASAIAKKTFIIVGGSDALMLLGIGIIYYLAGSMQMDMIKIRPDSGLAISAYLCIAVACFAKAGAMPFHSWIPDTAKDAPLPVVAYLPAALDKLLGIYLLARLSLNLFVMNNGLNIFLMVIGAFTIVAAVMMALVQHNMKKLLGYHVVSQVGYMILGIGTGNPIGIAGGLFHMLNNAIYKSCLFFTSGNVEYRTKTSELDELGGLARAMPLTYISALVASLSISGIPPFNGFFSKWMIYQGIVEMFKSSNIYVFKNLLCMLCLIAAMLGSTLTLASFMKIIHAVFLGQSPNIKTFQHSNILTEVRWAMWLPCIILAGLCIIFGVFAVQLPMKYFILPVVGPVVFIGAWYAGLSMLLIVVALAIGIFIVGFGLLKTSLRQDVAFTGTESLDLEEHRVTGTEFYNTIREFGIFKALYKKAEAGLFDIYEGLKKLVFAVSGAMQYLHNGILPTYLVWCLLGMAVLFFWFFR
ncbi:MAG: proton-conducting transporter membrane subunit [Candidatus Omnitrophica bacterium]|nr:proton-conducting transporter membrane subunit [Candidatus Omnitrophota bacterium]MDD5592229.1 proton-conducting transporter membrane subunit [Candidatus Omnitrophota bacterium]